MTKLNYQKAQFILSVANIHQLPPDQGIEIAIAGRSNAGKSSVLNQLTQNKNLAHTSKTPGRTQLINLFKLDENHRLADLPGYGYAKVPIKIKQHWEKLIDTYLNSRECLKGLLLIMDIRHPMRDHDQTILNWCDRASFPVHILLNKADKLSATQQQNSLQIVNKAVNKYNCPITAQVFSALRGTGLKELKALLDRWFGGDA